MTKETVQERIEALIRAIKAQKDKDYLTFCKRLNLLKKYENHKGKFKKSELNEILKLICFKNIGFCCDITKQCISRDCVLEILKINKDEYHKVKIEFGNQMIGITERKCRICGCTDKHACPGGCHWVEKDLCSTCDGIIKGEKFLGRR